VSNDLIRALEGAFEKKQVLTKASELLCYAYDATAGDARRVPDVVVLPASTDEVARVVRSGDTRRTKRPESGCERGRTVLQGARGRVTTGSLWSSRRPRTATVIL